MPYGLGRRLRNLCATFRDRFSDALELYPDIRAALLALEGAVQDHFPVKPGCKLRRSFGTKRIRQLQQRARRAKKASEAAQAKLQAITVGKASYKNATTPEFLAKVALSWPTTCARSFAGSWRDLVGVGVAGCSRTHINSVRNAFAEVLQEMRGKQCASVIASAAPAPVPISAASAPRSAALAPSFACAAILHIHDEASLRLRSSASTDTQAPSRSRSSKVQQHVIQVFARDKEPVHWPAELHPLADKSAKVLATSLHTTLRSVVDSVCPALGSVATSDRPWLIHWLVGDGIGTNEAAAKILFAWLRNQTLPGRTRYFVVVVKCANHQANLVIGSVVSGRIALLGTRCAGLLGTSLACRPQSNASGSAAAEVCGAVVRLFKYLISDYYSEYLANLQDICKRVSIGESSPLRQLQRQKWWNMQRLYGPSVLPDELLDCLNGELGDWTHCFTSAASAPDGSAAQAPATLDQVRSQLVEVLRSRVLVVDEQPTLTRMFTFQCHVECLLLLVLLGIAPELLQARGYIPRERARKRLAKVFHFLTEDGTMQYLKRTVLALQLVGHTHSICAQLLEDSEPLLVRLSKGAVAEAASTDMHRIFGLLHLDPDLDVSACVAVLLGAAVEVCLRFQHYKQWPYQAWKLSRVYNPDGHRAACVAFLNMPEEMLDFGFGLPLRKLCTAARSEVESIRFLLSEDVQSAIVVSFRASAASSLPAERAFAVTKRSEAPRLCHVATASRNQILRQHLRQRQSLLDAAESSAALLRQSLKLNIVNLAWQLKPELGKAALEGNQEMTKAFVKQHASKLEAEIQRRRDVAKELVDRTLDDEMPVTQAAWVSWFREHQAEFNTRMAEAGARRKAANRRMVAAPDTPQPVHRLSVQRGPVKVSVEVQRGFQ